MTATGDTRSRLLDFITRYHRLHKHGPSYREMANHIGLRSCGTIYHHLDELHKDGLVTWTDRKRGSIRPLPTVRIHSGNGWSGDTRTRLLLYITHYYEDHGYGPSYNDMMQGVGIARSSAFKQVGYLRAEGLVAWDAGKDSSLRPLVREVAV